MKNIKLTIEYDGTNYLGWQKQKSSKNTIQETIEIAISKIVKKEVAIMEVLEQMQECMQKVWWQIFIQIVMFHLKDLEKL